RDALSGGVVCDAPKSYAADAAHATVAGTCRDAAGNTASPSVGLRYDATGPTVTATPDRGPDANGWYNHALSVSFAGADTLSGDVTCDASKSYDTDASHATVTGSCRDAAGNAASS